MSCGRCCKREFGPSNFLLDYDNPEDFIQFQCGLRKPYVFWRIFWALYHLVWIVITGVYSWQWAGSDPAQQVKWFIYLTDWCYFMLTISTLFDAIVVVYINLQRPDIVHGEAIKLQWYIKADWVLFNVGNVASVTVAILYWGLVYQSTDEMTAVNIETHVLNAVYVLINICVVRVPVRFYHLFHSVIYGVVYIVFSAIYYAAGGTNEVNKPYIYSVIDWRKPGTAILYSIVVVFLALPAIHILLYGIYHLRILIYKRCCKNDENFPKSNMIDGYDVTINDATVTNPAFKDEGV